MEEEDTVENNLGCLGNCLWYKISSKREKRLFVLSTAAFSVVVVLIVTFTIILQTTQVNICSTPSCVLQASAILQALNESVEPCQNFYKFSCGRFLESRFAPDNLETVTWFSIAEDDALYKTKVLIEGINDDSLKPYILLQNFYNTCKQHAIDSKDVKIIKGYLTKMGGWPVLEGEYWKDLQFSWVKSMHSARKLGIKTDFFIDLTVEVDYRNTSRHVLTINKPTTLVTSKELLLDQEYAKTYLDFIVYLAVSVFGADEDTALKDLKDVVKFETKLAKFGLTKIERTNFTNVYNVRKMKDLQHRYPTVNWMHLIENTMAVFNGNILYPSEELVVQDIKYLDALLALLSRTPKRIQANYIMLRVILTNLKYLGHEYSHQYADFYKAFTGRSHNEVNWKDCVESAWKRLNLATEALYVNHYLNAEMREEAKFIASSVKSQFRSSIMENDWMDADTKLAALEKIDVMNIQLGYPKEYLTDSKLEQFYADVNIINGSYLEVVKKLDIFAMDSMYKRLRQPTESTDLFDTITEINLHFRPRYSSIMNSVVIPTTVLHAALSEKDSQPYINFGTLGFIISREISRGFNYAGVQFNAFGNAEDIWWSDKSRATFAEKMRCFVEQYDYSHPSETNEIISSIMGIKHAYRAYQASLRGIQTMLPGLSYNYNQLFWIAAAQTYCSKRDDKPASTEIELGSSDTAVELQFYSLESFANDFECTLVTNLDECSIL